ncbi:MAG: ETC complex I subunit [Alphaproteobacteria bacterium]
MSRRVRIYRPSKNTMQSGRANRGTWILEYETETARTPEALMGWVSSGDTLNQVRMKFPTCEDAEKFAKEKGWTAQVIPDRERKIRPQNYGQNFAHNRDKMGRRRATD